MTGRRRQKMIEFYEFNGMKFELISTSYGTSVVKSKMCFYELEFTSEFSNKYLAMEFILSHALKGVDF